MQIPIIFTYAFDEHAFNMSKSEKGSSEFTQEKRKLLYWISTWNGNEEHVQNVNFDVPELSVILQIMGYKFQEFEKLVEAESQNLSTMEITCHVSGTKSKFSKELSTCKCPTNEEMDNVQVWSVTGCGSSQNSIHSSTSSLIPTVPKGKIELISYLLAKIFSLINEKEVAEPTTCNNLSQNALLTRYRSLDTLKDNSMKRELSWEVDPPTQTSSPVPNITQTLSRITLDSDASDYAKDLEEIKNLVNEKWEKIKNASKNKSKKRVSDIKPVGPNLCEINPTTPRKTVTPKRYLTSSGKKTGIVTPSVVRKTPLSASTTRTVTSAPAKTTTLKKSTLVGKGNEVIFKSKIGATSKLRSTIGLSTAKSSHTNTSAIAKYTKKA